MDSERRLEVLRKQFNAHAPVADEISTIIMNPTAARAEEAEKVYAVPLPEKLTPEGPWQVFRSTYSPERLVSHFEAPDDIVHTLYDNLETSISRYPHVPYLGWRKRDDKGRLGAYTWLTYSQAGDIRTAIGSGLLQMGLKPNIAVGLYSVNCKEWVLLDSAVHAYSMLSVPLYDTLGPDAVEYICTHAEVAAVGCSVDVLQTMVATLPRCPSVKLLIIWGLGSGRLPELPTGSTTRIISIEQLEALGRRHPRPHIPPNPSDLATISYTSGTTGVPKGAMLTHANLIANAAGTLTVLPLTPPAPPPAGAMLTHANLVANAAGTARVLDFSPGERHLSYLPLAHIYERVNLVLCTHTGASLGFYSGNVQELLDDVLELKPHIFVSVPRLWNRIYDRVTGTIRGGSAVSRALFERAYAHKKAALERGDPVGGRMGRFWDKLVFSKIRAKLGGEVKYLTTGASPISGEVMTFLRVCFGAIVLEGYGMTESSCTMSLTRPDDYSTGHVGAPLPSCEMKLEDIPEMGYTTADQPYPRGEVCVRGPIVFAGYYKDEVQTREVVDEDGWLHTGDVGMWLPGGRLKIIDRKKNIFKLAQGEYIAPEKIENVYNRSPMVLQSFVYGDSLKPSLVALVVPDPEVLLPWAAQRQLPQDVAQLCADPKVAAAVFKSMVEEGRAAQLRGFEQVAAIRLVPEPFTVENALLTPTFKLKRPQAQKLFQTLIDELYASLPGGASL